MNTQNKFSNRNGLSNQIMLIQRDNIDNVLKNDLWSVIYFKIFGALHYNKDWKNIDTIYFKFSLDLWQDFFVQKIDEFPQNGRIMFHYIKVSFFELDWYVIYDFIEYIIEICQSCPEENKINIELFITEINEVLIKNSSAYRIVNGVVAEITSPMEIQSIEDSFEGTISPVQEHLKTALVLLSNKKNPDYRNSVKESISALESICAEITKEPKEKFSTNLATVASKFKLHSSLKEVFNKLYGYGCDFNGIRHKLVDLENKVSHEDALLMLITCSAITNYLKQKMLTNMNSTK